MVRLSKELLVWNEPGRPFRAEFKNRLIPRACALGEETKTNQPCEGDRLLTWNGPGRPFRAELKNRLFLRASPWARTERRFAADGLLGQTLIWSSNGPMACTLGELEGAIGCNFHRCRETVQ